MPAKKPPSKPVLAQLDETGTRTGDDRRKTAGAAPRESRKTNRRRQIDPTTCERDYTEQEIEFMQAMDEYKQKSGRMFPTCSEILEVLTTMGYRKIAASSEFAGAGMPTLDCSAVLGSASQVEF